MRRNRSLVGLSAVSLLLFYSVAPIGCGSSVGNPNIGNEDAGGDGAATAEGGGQTGSDGSGSGGGNKDGSLGNTDGSSSGGQDSSLADGSSGGGDGSSAGDGSPSGGDGSSVNDGGAGGNDGSSGGDTSTCSPLQTTCSQASDCCSHLCLGNTCATSVQVCGAAGAACGVNTDCCNGSCVNGYCSTAQCLSLGASCPVAGDSCCTDTCVNGKCAPIGTLADGGGGPPSSCTTSGNACTTSTQCCSGLCGPGNTCAIASSWCVQTNDICFNGADCCTGTCAAPNGNPVSASNPGLCAPLPSTGPCSGVDGTLCNPADIGCKGGCCSALCAPYGPTGVAVCTQAQGCHVEGDLCQKDTDCCGGESVDAGILGAGLVTCNVPAGGTIGTCSSPSPTSGGHNACVPAGDVCQLNNSNSDGGYMCPSSSTRSDCCDGQNPDKYLCQLDRLGVPRCLIYQGGSDAGLNTCRQTGDTCSTANDCCNGQPCVPGPSGQLVCASTSCIPTTGACTSNADCCAGSQCVVPPGSLSGSCQAPPPPPPPPPPPSDGGTSDGGTSGDGGSSSGDGGSSSNDGGGSPRDAETCALYGQSCASAPCCALTACINGICLIPQN
jgi:hypothetical protein